MRTITTRHHRKPTAVYTAPTKNSDAIRQQTTPERKPRSGNAGSGILPEKKILTILASALLLVGAGTAGVHGAVYLMSSTTPGAESTTGEEKGFYVIKNESTGSDPLTGSANGSKMTVIEVVAAVKNTVVRVSAEMTFDAYTVTTAGSGVIISTDGTIVTNRHLVEGGETVKVKVTLADGTELEATVTQSDAASDLALLHINPEGLSLQAAVLGSSADLAMGENILAIGNPPDMSSCAVTAGIVSATQRKMLIGEKRVSMIQTNIPVNLGDSGGGLFNMAGQLIGIMNASVSSDDAKGLGFALPVDAAYAIIMQLHENGHIQGEPTNGLGLFETSSQQLAWRRFCAKKAGVFVLSSQFSGAMQYGDRLLSVDGTAVKTIADVEELMSDRKVGDTVTFVLERVIGRVQTEYFYETVIVNVTLVEYVPAVATGGNRTS